MLTYLLFIVCRMFLFPLTSCNTSSFLTRLVATINERLELDVLNVAQLLEEDLSRHYIRDVVATN